MAMQPQQQMPHPTIGMLGQGGGFPPEGQPTGMQPQQGIGMPQYYGPAPVNGFVPQQPQQPQQQGMPYPQQNQPVQMQPWQQFQQPQFQQPAQPQQQMLPPQQQQRLQVQGGEVLDGPGVPMELRGRTMAQVMQIYNTLADDHLRNRRQQGQPQQPQQQQPWQQAQQQQAPQQQLPPQGQRPQTFWQNPDAAVGQQVGQAVQQAIAPMQEHILRQSIQAAQQQVFGSMPDFMQLQPELMPLLKDASPENLARPEFLEGAADLARGRMLRRGMQQQPPQQQQRFAPATPQFPQPTYQFFTEGPTPPMGVYGGGQVGSLTPEQLQAAQGFGMSPEAYMAWQGGQQSQRNGRRW